MPARFRDIKRVAGEFGIRAQEPSSGSHWKLIDRQGKTYPLVCHNGERSEISDVYLRGLCRCFSLDYDDFVRRL